MPFVNWALMLVTLALVCSFGSSSRLASAYGIAVTLSMLITTLLADGVARSWGQEHLLLSEQRGVQRLRLILFTFLSRIAQPATRFFNISAARVMEVGIRSYSERVPFVCGAGEAAHLAQLRRRSSSRRIWAARSRGR